VKALNMGVGICPGSIFWPPGTENTGYVRIHCGVSHEKALQVRDNLLSHVKGSK